MKHQKSIFLAVIVLSIGVLSAYTYSIWPQPSNRDPKVVPTKLISKTQGIGGVVLAEPEAKDGSAAAPTPPSPEPTNTEAITETAPRQAEIKKSVETEYPYRALRTSNDPLPQPSWVNNATKAPLAWDTATGNGVVVAVIDTGFALAHEDLASQWYQNPGETGMTTFGGRCWTGVSLNKSSNNCDDDNNGYKDDWRGWDFVGVNNSPQAGETNPAGNGVAHGTEVAGLVGAAGNNSIGTSTMAWNNRIMPLQALDDDGAGYTSGVASAVYYAVDNGAKVVNLSLGGDTNDPALATAVSYAFDRGVVVVAAAGNCGTGTEQGCDPSKPGAMSYPALNPHVIAVGATTSTDVRASFSSYGPGLDVVAPGSGTLISPMWHSSNQTSAYATSLYGTSFASPIVASYIGLLKSIRQNSSVDDITALVSATASKPFAMGADMFSTQLGHGLIDTQVGLRVAGSLNSTTGTPELAQTGSNVSEHSFTTSSALGSGCKITTGTYCTIWATNSAGYDRYLPYKQTSSDSQTGWQWTGNWLGTGEWSLKSRSGNQQSTTPYVLFNR